VDPGQPGNADEVLAEDLVPQILDRLDLGEEPVSPDIETVPLVPGSLGNTADDVGALEYRDGMALLGQDVGGNVRSLRSSKLL